MSLFQCNYLGKLMKSCNLPFQKSWPNTMHRMSFLLEGVTFTSRIHDTWELGVLPESHKPCEPSTKREYSCPKKGAQQDIRYALGKQYGGPPIIQGNPMPFSPLTLLAAPSVPFVPFGNPRALI